MAKRKSGFKKAPLDNNKKTAIIREYRKLLKTKNNKEHKSNVDQIPGASQNVEKNRKMPLFKRALKEYEQKQNYREEKRQAKEAKIKERDEAIRKYKEKKRENFKKLSQKTKWGQPVMKGRMEILLEKIEKSILSDQKI